MIKTQKELSDTTTNLHPRPSFVVKTRLTPQGTKVFLNICTSDEVPQPSIPWSAKIVFPLIMENQWEIPIITSEERQDMDKKGNLAYVYDCVIHSKCMRWCLSNPELMEILIEWCLESVELRSDGISLDREKISRPKMTSKGDIPPLVILNEDLNINNRLNEEFERKLSSPLEILQEKRLDEEGQNIMMQGTENDDNVDIFNINRDPLAVVTRPLIQEINDMKIDSNPSSPKRSSNIISEISKSTKKKIKYETTIIKLPETHKYKIRIHVISQIDSSLDYDLQLDTQTSILFLKVLNTDLYETKDLQIPLPLGMTDIKSYFVKKEGLYVFVK